ncbi:SAM-dependent methyltransferase [Tumebacillus permanentifrigoris]|uniref:23S rRNA (Cytidine2498-2'-O)-methyltransferase n=1 Tax=Tumebacillus permanentifrigoris TaxID=378543 RepID=A0A316DCD2_9BACL|nr:SAM-dependent methyltransferase [Tumebacillus permanentifrigoris]PWK13893.1 23S rRNA (cytidine2498-2'-O)-methyltransferase [Tumebacillus permanentifrigoris]
MTTRMIGTTNHGFAQYAQEEIRRKAPGVKFQVLEPGEVFLIHTEVPLEEMQRSLQEDEPIFLRHVQPVTQELSITRTRADLDMLINFVQDLTGVFTPGERVAVQVRKAPGVKCEYTPYGVKEAIDPILAQTHEVEPVIQKPDRIISIYLTAELLYWGISKPEENLSDWSGGAVRYKQEEGQISRAVFKLLEAEERFGLDLASFERALDIGAAPGGWSSLLLKRGLQVTAVDPGEMHADLLSNPNLKHLKNNAGDVRFEEDAFDLLVCDMSWSPKQMSKLVFDLLDALQVGGTAIITVKLMHGKAFQAIKETVAAFGGQLELLKAKQLFHNRDELTLYLLKQ